MRRVNIRYGLKQRLNDILGTDYGVDPTNPDIPDITHWSIQAAILTNTRRTVAAMVSDSAVGRPMRGMVLQTNNSSSFKITAGYGFTSNGDIVVTSVDIIPNVDFLGSIVYIYLKHMQAELPESVDGGLSTNFIGKSGSENIVYDDFAATVGSEINQQSNYEQILVQSDKQQSDTSYVYIGKVNITDGAITSVVPNPERGLPSAIVDGIYTITSSLSVGGDLEIEGDTTLNGDLTVSGDIIANGKLSVIGTFQADLNSIFNGSVVFNAAIYANSGVYFNTATEVFLPSTANKITMGVIPTVTDEITIAVGDTLNFINGILCGYVPAP